MAASAILYVDDDPDICASMSDVICDLGYRVDVAFDGQGALELCHQRKYGLALLDFKLPGMNGVELFRNVKRESAGTVGVLVTGFASDDTTHDAMEVGMREVMPKPVDFGRLISLIEEVAGKP